MIREDRYLVLKRKDISAHLDANDIAALDRISRKIHAGRTLAKKPPLQCVVVEQDWPEHERVWQLIAARVKVERCTHTWRLAQVAGEGRYCTQCGHHDYNFED